MMKATLGKYMIKEDLSIVKNLNGYFSFEDEL